MWLLFTHPLYSLGSSVCEGKRLIGQIPVGKAGKVQLNAKELDLYDIEVGMWITYYKKKIKEPSYLIMHDMSCFLISKGHKCRTCFCDEDIFNKEIKTDKNQTGALRLTWRTKDMQGTRRTAEKDGWISDVSGFKYTEGSGK